ncbi:uncharacterized protein [Eleutherodactylus coqui]|uniref:Uncharacterized protein n=1 Tax=Eleutherodactylus coqui TaxID=57060 RepID=A0A8J6EKP4_ELECQ|nr:hypothetical protein GDO78_016858 [Eleutherodactylus coqui]
MEKLYSTLREEIKVFEEQVQKCRVNFDLPTLQRALALFSEDHKENPDSWKKINKYIQSTPTSGEQGLQLHRYFSWLLSYIGHLGTMKDAFDDHVVFRLCDNLYINDEAETLTIPSAIPLSPGNIVGTARQLFHHRRNWALLLSSGIRNSHGPCHPMGLLHSIPDIFEESLVTANLARNWILLHEARHKNPPSLAPQPSPLDHEFQVRRPRKFLGSTESAANAETQAELKDVREHLMFLLWKAGRANALEQQVKDAKQKVQSLQQDINDLQQLIQRDGEETSDISLENQRQLGKLQRQLDLEIFNQRIVSCDWQLELEVRPALIRQIDMVRERCAQLEASLNAQKEPHEASALESVGGISDGEWENSSVFSHSSAHSSDVFSTH